MDESNKRAYIYLLYRLLVDIRLNSSTGFVKWWNPFTWKQGIQYLRKINALADTFHNLPIHISTSSDFDEENFWRFFIKRFPKIGESYRIDFEKERIRFKLYDVDLQPPWRLINKNENGGMVKELRNELSDDHVLKNKYVRAIARSDANDDVLFEVDGEEYSFANVHLTWSGKQELSGYPKTKIYSNIDEWLVTIIPDH